jgi:glucose/arabinose dehydrogenase
VSPYYPGSAGYCPQFQSSSQAGIVRQPQYRTQDPRKLLGKILRIDPGRQDPGKAYASPSGNPFLGSAAGREEIYALGFRNPWRFSFDRITGLLYAGDVGQGQIEEVDVVYRGGNYRWRIFEGARCTNLGPASCSAAGLTPPIAQYGHESGRRSL